MKNTRKEEEQKSRCHRKEDQQKGTVFGEVGMSLFVDTAQCLSNAQEVSHEMGFCRDFLGPVARNV